MSSLNSQQIAKFDSQNMLERILRFPEQLRHALEIATSVRMDHLASSDIANVCITGMGGSAIGGDVVRAYLAESLRVPITVNRYYALPASVDQNSLVFVSSYSGNTEETLAAYEDALRKKARIICITSGGELAQRAIQRSQPVFSLPSGFAPRAALGYMTVSLLFGLHYAGLIDNPAAAIVETADVIAKLGQENHPDVEINPAKSISRKLVGKIPLVYAGGVELEPVALRWKGQLSENSKVLAFANVFPELNHNEIVGWGPYTQLSKRFQVIYLYDQAELPQIRRRRDITKQIIEKYSQRVVEVRSTGGSRLSRIFSLIFLGDIVSLYLAILNQVDPTPVENIDFLKRNLSSNL